MVWRRIYPLVLLFWFSAAHGSPEIEVGGLFNGGAVLIIDGRHRLLRVGQTSPEGVSLRAADSREAIVETGGQRYQLGMSKRISASFSPAESKIVSVPRNGNNQYLIGGAINGFGTDFLVDTGANVVAMSSHTARALGIDYRRESNRGLARTASGLVTSYRVKLDSVTVGDITVHHVEAFVNEGAYPELVLLGMSFLRHVQMRDSRGVLYLEQ